LSYFSSTAIYTFSLTRWQGYFTPVATDPFDPGPRTTKQDRLFESGAVGEDFTFNDQVAESPAEQRRTEWMIFESYEDCIDKEHTSLTIE
jgi:hypothetical protein